MDPLKLGRDNSKIRKKTLKCARGNLKVRKGILKILEAELLIKSGRGNLKIGETNPLN